MGIFDFLKRGSNKTSQKSEAEEILKSFQKNINEWSDLEKALLFSLLNEIAWADGDVHKTEKASLAKSAFGVGIFNDIMEIQNLADKMYSKSEVEGDLEKIANDFNNLSSVKQEYIMKSVSEIIEADGTISTQEISMANKLTGRNLHKKNGKLINNNKETSKSSELNEEQKIVVACYPKLKGINFSKVKFGASGNSAAEFFASDIDGDWHYAQSQMIMLFKAFSKDKIESELKLLLNQNEINFDEKIEKTELLAEHWAGDGFKIEHPVMEGIDIIIITNENMVPQNYLTLQETDLAPEVKLPTGYENIGIEHVYDGSKFLKANQGQLSLNIPLLFKDNDDSPHYILIGVTTLTLAKRIIDNIIENNYGKQYFKELDEKDGWQYTYANKFFSIGFFSKYNCVRINMLHNLVDIREM